MLLFVCSRLIVEHSPGGPADSASSHLVSSCSHFTPINNPTIHVEEADAGRKTWRRGTCGGDIETNDEFSVEGCQPGDTRSTQFEFRTYQHGETRGGRFERKHTIEFSSVAFGCKHDHQHGETSGGNDKGKQLVHRLGQGRNPVGLVKSGRTIHEFSFPCERWGGVNSTPHLARIHTRKVSRACGSNFSSSVCSVQCVRCLQNIYHLARMPCSARCLTRH